MPKKFTTTSKPEKDFAIKANKSNHYEMLQEAFAGKRKSAPTTSDESSWTKFKPLPDDIKEMLYKKDPYSFRAVNIYAHHAMSLGYVIKSKNPEVVKIMEQFRKDSRLDSKMLQVVKDGLVDGDSYCEIIFNESQTDIVDLAVLNPVFIDFERDEMGRLLLDSNNLPKGYVQKIGNRFLKSNSNNIKFTREQIAHFIFFRLADEMNGISLFESTALAAQYRMNADSGAAEAARRHGYPQFDVTVGDENNPATQAQIDTIATALEDINSMNEFIHEYLVQIRVIEPLINRNFGDYGKYFVDLEIAGFGIPKPLISGLGDNSNKAVLQVQSLNFKPEIQAIQLSLAAVIEEKILFKKAELLGFPKEDWPTIEWNTTLEETEVDKFEAIGRVFELGIVSRNEARELLGMPPTSIAEEPPKPAVVPEPATIAPAQPQMNVDASPSIYTNFKSIFELAEDGTKVQTIIFKKSEFPTASAAKSWATEHGFSAHKVDETEESFRLRQAEPSDFQEGSFRTKEIAKGVSIVVAKPK